MNAPAPLSRRQWFGQMSAPVLATVAGSHLVAASAAGAEAGTDRVTGAGVHDIRDHGARGDGTTLDTVAIQAAIDACHAARGGVVLVPAGTFLSGTLELKSYVTLHLAAGARLLGSGNPADYHAGEGVPKSNGNIVFLSAANAEHVLIEGTGTIDGNGAKFFTGKGDMTGPGQNSADGYFQRPHLLVFYRCTNLRIRDVFLTASAYHCLRTLECRDVHYTGVRILNRVNKNNDGFHLVSNQYLHLVDCDVQCQDDACALFGSNKWVTITNCSFSTRWSVFRFGGGDPENITVSNCLIYDTFGCPVKMRFGRTSRAQNILFSNLVFQNVTGPVSVGCDHRPRPGAAVSDPPPIPGFVRNLAFRGIRATVVAEGRQFPDMPWEQVYRPGEVRTCFVFNGVGGACLENISLDDVHATFEGGGTAGEARAEVPAIAGEYFEIGTPPAYGIYARGVRGLTLHNVRLTVSKPDLRPAMVLDLVSDAAISGLGAQGTPDAEALLRFSDTQDVLLSAPRVLAPAAVFLQVEGAATANVTIDGGDLTKAARSWVAANGADASAVRLRG
ncbi:MAG TPA: glycosyl hydrolase family 28 protein [Lacunisphaera sp.]|nr:glycosyl hydrolase family 28 protein [Lacunisphaera sp.]